MYSVGFYYLYIMGNEKILNLDFEGDIDKNQIIGFYFKSENDKTSHFLVAFDLENSTPCIAKIYSLEDIPQRNGEILELNNGDKIASMNLDEFVEIDLYGKYFFPRFMKEQYQWYYNQSYKNNTWGFDKDGNSNQIQSMADVMKFAVYKGIELAEIELY